MNDVPRQKLQAILTQYGQAICNDPKRCEALLRDLCPDAKREINLLMNALREDVTAELTAPANRTIPVEVVCSRLTQRLHDHLGIVEHFAQWAVESWAIALGLLSAPHPSHKGGATSAAAAPAASVRRAPADLTGSYQKITLSDLLTPQRDPFETSEEFQARREELLTHFNRGSHQHDPHYQAGTATLQKDGYDIASGRFPMNIAWNAWANALPKPCLPQIAAARDDAKALWQEGAQKPVFLTLRLTADGCAVETAEVVGLKRGWELLVHQVETVEYLVNGVRFEMVSIPGGTFLMGAPKNEAGSSDDERPQHSVTIQPFYMGKYPVTQAQWQAIMGNNPSNWKEANRPVEQVSWNDCQTFLQSLNAIHPLPLPGGELSNVSPPGRGKGWVFRLPTEAEWEYACRAGTQTAYSFGDDQTQLGNYGWFNGNSGSQTHPVGQKPPNAFGLYDMHGNVWEWCQDWFDERYYASSPTENPQGPPSGQYRVLRGGAWYNDSSLCRSASRRWYVPDLQSYYVGVRVVAVLART